MTIIIPVDAGIAVGKTTLLKRLQHTVASANLDRPCIIEQEPVDQWMDVKPPGMQESIFEMYYRDKQKYGFAFQMLALQTRFEQLRKLKNDNPSAIIICERSPLTDCAIFAKMLRSQGIISPYEFEVYMKWYTFVMDILQPDIRGIIYLRADPDVCAARITKRNRQGEDKIDIAYLNMLHEQHEQWLMNPAEPLPIPVCVIDGNCAQHEVDIDRIMEFVRSVSTTA